MGVVETGLGGRIANGGSGELPCYSIRIFLALEALAEIEGIAEVQGLISPRLTKFDHKEKFLISFQKERKNLRQTLLRIALTRNFLMRKARCFLN